MRNKLDTNKNTKNTSTRKIINYLNWIWRTKMIVYHVSNCALTDSVVSENYRHLGQSRVAPKTSGYRIIW